jgi:hypothetical protein
VVELARGIRVEQEVLVHVLSRFHGRELYHIPPFLGKGMT